MEGLWTAEFGSNIGIVGGGVVVFRDGKILGGDGTYYYVGEYTVKGTVLQAKLRLSPFIEGAESVFKTVGRDLTLELVGSLIGNDRATAQGHPIEIPEIIFGVTLIRRY